MLKTRLANSINQARNAGREGRTRDDVTCVHLILVFDEAEAIHELDLGNLAGAMGVEMVLNVRLGSYIQTVQLAMPVSPEGSSCARPALPAPAPRSSWQTMSQSLTRSKRQHVCIREHTEFGKIAQVPGADQCLSRSEAAGLPTAWWTRRCWGSLTWPFWIRPGPGRGAAGKS